MNGLSRKIISHYEKNISLLPPYEMGHFFTRAYKITGNKKYENILSSFMLLNNLEVLDDFFNSIKRGKFEYRVEKKMLLARTRIRERYLYYQKNPKIKLYLDLLQYLIYIEKFNLWNRFLSKRKKELVAILKKENFEEILLNEKAIRTNGSYVFNALAVLKRLRVCDLTKKALIILKNIYFDRNLSIKKDLTVDESISFLYALSHIIIADTSYYERYCKKYGWIIEFFSKNLEFVIKNSTNDLLAEIGVCFKLCKKEKQFKAEFLKIKKTVYSRVTLNKIKEKKLVITKEHMNSLIMMLFFNGLKFFPGPDLSKNEIILNSAKH